MKMYILLILTLIFIVISLLLVFGTFRTWKTQISPNQKLFLGGKVPDKLPDGFFKGQVTGYKGNWQGKRFDAKNGSGVNIFKEEGREVEKYPFKIYKSEGLQDNIQVLKIDYNLSGNPLWMRFIVDEIVETEKNKYLGKIHVSFVPGLPISIGYFKLEKWGEVLN